MTKSKPSIKSALTASRAINLEPRLAKVLTAPAKGRMAVVTTLADAGMNSEEIVRWLLTRTRVLKGRTPFSVLKDPGGLRRVLMAAHAFVEGAYV